MLAAENSDPSAKIQARADRHQILLHRVNALCRDLDAHTVAEGEPDVALVERLVAALGEAMASAPGGDAWTFLWRRYCRWQLWLSQNGTDDCAEFVAREPAQPSSDPEERVCRQQRMVAAIRSVPYADRVACAHLIVGADPGFRLSGLLFAALAAAAHDDDVWDALAQERQVVIMNRAADE